MRRFIAVMLFFLMLTGCQLSKQSLDGKQEQTLQTLTWVHHFGEEGARKWLDIGTTSFKNGHPEYAFVLQGVDGGDYISMLRTRVVASNMPDIYMIDSNESAKDLIDSGYAMDLTGQPFLNNIDDKYLKGVKTADGKIWALPIDVNGAGVTYNKDAFDKAGIHQLPTTYSEFLLDCRKLKEAGIIPIAAGYKDSWTLTWDVNPDILAVTMKYDQNWYKEVEAGTASFEDDKGHLKDVLKRLRQRLAYTNEDPFQTDWNNAQQLVAYGKAAMIINGTWTVDGVKSKNPDARIGLFAFPFSENPEDAKFAIKTTGGIVVNPKSPNRDAALRVLAFFTTPEMGKVFQKEKKAISVIKGVGSDVDPTYIEFNQQYLKSEKTFDWSSLNIDFKNPDLGKALIDGLMKFVLDKNHDVDKCIKDLDFMFNNIRKPLK